MPHTNEVVLVPNQGWDERLLVCRNGEMVDTFIVVTERYVVLIDTVINPATARQMLAFAQPHLTGARQLLVVNTHADYDHAWGNQIFDGPHAEHTAPIIGTRGCAELLRSAEGAAYLQEMQKKEPALFGEVVLTPPTLLFDEQLTIDGGDLTLELFATPGHTVDHAAIFIPEISTLLAADAAELPFPLARTVEGLPTMRASLAKLAALDAATVLYCHAPVTIGPGLIQQNIRYYDQLEARCRAALANGAPPQPAADVDVAALIDYPFADAVTVGAYGDFIGEHHARSWHPHAIRMMLEWVA
jgi:glyoxylase-like metal-dependent hydrolase (beta-lactamase superfamily II)